MSKQFPAPPLVYVGSRQAQETRISLVQDTDEGITHKNIADLDQLNSELAKTEATRWINVVGLKNLDVINELCGYYNIHPLVIEDILHTEQMPKIDIFDDYLYVVIRVPKTVGNAVADATFNQISFVIMKNRLLTFQEENDESFATIQNQFLNYLPKTRKFTIDYIVYSLLDSVLDNYFKLTERQNEVIEAFEDKLIKNPENLSLIELYKLKRNVMNLRKAVQPMRDVISVLSRQGIDFLEETTHVYFNDLYDHCLRISEQLDSFRDLLTSMLEIYRSSVNNNLNESMRMLSLIATVFMPITFLASLFSTNFKDQVLLGWHYGFNAMFALIVLTVVGMLIYFRMKKWM
jgi:magnesium transporter